jgi:multiple antibiotic resistance protein
MHAIALWAFGLATFCSVGGALLGRELVDRWHISLPALTLTAGLIFFLVAIRQLVAQYNPPQTLPTNSLPESPSAAAALLLFPVVLTPYGIAAIIALLEASQATERTVTILGLLVLVMFLNLLAMWFVRRILVGFVLIGLQVLGAVLAVLQVALSVQFMIVGLRALRAFS